MRDPWAPDLKKYVPLLCVKFASSVLHYPSFSKLQSDTRVKFEGILTQSKHISNNISPIQKM
jgi:hypothetical protein